MPEFTVLIPFALACLALYVTPGADMTYIIVRTAQYGFRTGVVCGLAVFVGILVHIMVAGIGVAAILSTSQTAFMVIKYAGAVYLLYLAFRLIRDNKESEKQETGEFVPDLRIFWEGVLVNVLNPKISLFMLAFLPQFIDASKGGAFFQFLLLGMMFNVGGLIWSVLLVFSVTHIRQKQFVTKGMKTALRWLAASVLGGLAVRLAVTDR